MKNLITLKKAMGLTMLAIVLVGFQSCQGNNSNDKMMDNQQFVTDASSSNNFEIAVGNLAVTNATNGEIQSYGRRMVSDHGAIGTALIELATNKGWTVSTEMQKKHRDDLEHLAGLTGEEFDKEFASKMVKSHEDAVALFTDAADAETGVRDNALRGFASDKLPGLKSHLEAAESLKASLNSSNTSRDSIMRDSLLLRP